MKKSLIFLAALAIWGCSGKEAGTPSVGDPVIKLGTKTEDKTPDPDNGPKRNAITTFSTDVTEKDLGLPFYPGSKEQPDSARRVDEATVRSAVCVRTTKDDPDKVVEFYKSRLESPEPATFSSGGNKNSTVHGKLKDGSEVAVTATKNEGKDTQVTVLVKLVKSGKQ